MTSVDGVAFDEAWAGRVRGTLGDYPIAFVGLREYILTKRASGRIKDAADLESLAELLGDLDDIVDGSRRED